MFPRRTKIGEFFSSSSLPLSAFEPCRMLRNAASALRYASVVESAAIHSGLLADHGCRVFVGSVVPPSVKAARRRKEWNHTTSVAAGGEQTALRALLKMWAAIRNAQDSICAFAADRLAHLGSGAARLHAIILVRGASPCSFGPLHCCMLQEYV